MGESKAYRQVVGAEEKAEADELAGAEEKEDARGVGRQGEDVNYNKLPAYNQAQYNKFVEAWYKKLDSVPSVSLFNPDAAVDNQ